MNIKKLLKLLVAVPIIGCLFTGCSIDDKDAIIKYAKRNYGDVEFISEEVLDNGTKVCTFHDKAGFDFEVMRGLASLNIDNSNFGSYKQTVTSYDVNYAGYVLSELYKDYSIENWFSVSHSITPKSLKIDECVSIILLKSEVEDTSKLDEIAKGINEADIYNKFNGVKVYVRDNSNNYYGCLDIDNKKYLNEEETAIEYYKEQFASYTNSKIEDLTFVKKETKQKSKIPNINKADPINVLGSPDFSKEGITVYYFKFADGSEHFITNYNVRNESKNAGLTDAIYYNDITLIRKYN